MKVSKILSMGAALFTIFMFALSVVNGQPDVLLFVISLLTILLVTMQKLYFQYGLVVCCLFLSIFIEKISFVSVVMISVYIICYVIVLREEFG